MKGTRKTQSQTSISAVLAVELTLAAIVLVMVFFLLNSATANAQEAFAGDRFETVRDSEDYDPSFREEYESRARVLELRAEEMRGLAENARRCIPQGRFLDANARREKNILLPTWNPELVRIAAILGLEAESSVASLRWAIIGGAKPEEILALYGARDGIDSALIGRALHRLRAL